MNDLFGNSSGAKFSNDRKYRYALWRIWDENKPLVMFIGLNPSTANETEPDATIRSVIRISKHNGYGGCYMMNCFPFVSTDPNQLRDFGNTKLNDQWLEKIRMQCADVVFAWGNFKVVRDLGRDKELQAMFPDALVIGLNTNGSPKHPLFQKGTSKLIRLSDCEILTSSRSQGNDSEMLFHECPICNWRCNCSNQPCSHCRSTDNFDYIQWKQETKSFTEDPTGDGDLNYSDADKGL